MPEVIIDGVRYAPINQQVATEARFYYMHDGDPDIMRLLAQVGGHTENKKGGPGE